MSGTVGELTASDGARLHLRTWTAVTDPVAVVVLCHGLGEHSGRYEHVAAALNEADIALVAHDLRGHGESPGKRGHASCELLLADLDTSIAHARTLAPAAPVFLYGHSLGGVLVIRYAQLRQPPLAGIVASAPALRPAFEPPAWKLAAAKLLAGVWPSLALGNELDLNALCRDPEVVATYRDDPLTHDRISARLGLDTLAAGVAARRDVDMLRVPTLLLHGDADRLTSCPASRAFAAEAGDLVEHRELPGVYHEPHNDPGWQQVVSGVAVWIRTRASQVARAPR